MPPDPRDNHWHEGRCMTSEEAGEWLRHHDRLLSYFLRGQASANDWEDLLQEARLAAWRCLQQATDRYQPSTLVKIACQAARRQFWQSSRPLRPRREPVVTLDAREWGALRVEDFAPRLVARCWQRSLYQAALALARPAERPLFAAVFGAGQSVRQAAIELSIKERTAHEWLRAVLVRVVADQALPVTRPAGLRELARDSLPPATDGRRRTHCPQGHLVAGDNLRVTVSGKRICRECRRAVDRNRPARKGRKKK